MTPAEWIDLEDRLLERMAQQRPFYTGLLELLCRLDRLIAKGLASREWR